MSNFIEWLEGLNAKDSKVRAILRRSLAFDPGFFVPAYPYVEPFVRDEESHWRREMLYLVSGLWAAHWREGRTGPLITIGKACALFDREMHQKTSKIEMNVSSIERRFLNLLDSDSDQLSHRLRQILALLREYTIDFDGLLKGILYWNDELKRTQNRWARDFYRIKYQDVESINKEESNENIN